MGTRLRPVVTGASAGAINGAMIAAGTTNFHRATQLLAELWSDLRVHDVLFDSTYTRARSSTSTTTTPRRESMRSRPF